MDDLVKRLRSTPLYYGYGEETDLNDDAADAIEALQARVAELEVVLKTARRDALEAAAKVAETVGVYPELNVYGGGPEWYKHGKEIAAAIRALAEKG